MHAQRVRIRWEPDETQIIKWTAEGAVKGSFVQVQNNPPSILRRWAYVSCRRYDGISSECAGIPVKQGGTADEYEIMIFISQTMTGITI